MSFESIRAELALLEQEQQLVAARLVEMTRTKESLEAELVAANARILELEGVIDPVPEPPPPQAGYGVLFNADTDQPITDLISGATYPIAGMNVTVVARPNPAAPVQASSVRFSFDGAVIRTENGQPWAMYGDTSGNLGAGKWALGNHEVKIEFFSAQNAGGTLLTTTTYAFTAVAVADAPDPPPANPDPIPIPEGEIITSTAALVAACKSGGNRTLKMAPGSYGDAALSALGSLSSRILITSADRASPAKFSGFDLKGAKNIGIDHLLVERNVSAGGASRFIQIADSDGVRIEYCTIRGTGSPLSSTGILANSGCKNVRVAYNDIMSVGWGYAGGGVNLKVLWNRYTKMGSDAMQFGSGIVDAEIAFNYATDWTAVEGAHPDGVQMGSWAGNPSKRVWVHDNVFWRRNGSSFQGIFSGNEGAVVFEDLKFENNLIHSRHAHGIRPAMGGGRGCIIRNNTAISTDPGYIMLNIGVSGSGPDLSITRNIADTISSSASESYALGSSPNYDAVFVDFSQGNWTLENYRVKPGITAGADVDRLVEVVA
jgi:hypothetical protein